MSVASTHRRGSKGRVIGWMFIAFGALAASVWVWSGWSRPSILRTTIGKELKAEVLAGRLVVEWTADSERTPTETIEFRMSHDLKEPLVPWRRPGWFINYAPVAVTKTDTFAKHGVIVTVALWPLAAATLLGGTLLIRSAVRARCRSATACLRCGYSLLGLATAAHCPECGMSTT